MPRSTDQTAHEDGLRAVDAVALGYFSAEMLARVEAAEGATTARALLTGGGVWRRTLQTDFGAIAQFICPIETQDVLIADEPLVEALRHGVAFAAAVGARGVSLTGLLGAATGGGDLVRAAVLPDFPGLRVTDGLFVTVPAIIITLRQALDRFDRSLAMETLGLLGLGSVGRQVLFALASGDILARPRTILLCDPWLTTEAVDTLRRELRSRFAFDGALRLVGCDRAGRPLPEFYACTAMLAATNSPDVLDVSRLRQGTVVVDDSAPHCFSVPQMLARIAGSGDVLATEGGMLRLPSPITETVNLSFEMGKYFRNFRPDENSIMGCLLSAGILAAGTVPEENDWTVGVTSRTLRFLDEVGCKSAVLHIEDTRIYDKLLNFRSFKLTP